MARTRIVNRWRRNMEVRDDAEYVDMLTTLSEGSVRRNFNPYTDIDWDSPEFAVVDNDERWILPATDPFGRHPWYQAQSKERQIEIGMWRQANVAKVGLHFESILIRGLMEYSFWTPNGSPEYRYCLHEAVEECNHTMMFQEMVNRIGADVPGMPRLLKWIQPFIPLVAGPLPIPFWFGILAGEEPIDHTQKNVLREGKTLHPIMERVMAIHVAEEARHISFAHEYLRKRVPHLPRRKRFWLSLYVPLTMRILCSAIIVPPRAFWKEFDIPRSVRKEIFFRSPESRQMLRDMFGDVRMLCHDTGLINPIAKLVWRICKIDGRPSRYRSEPQRQHLVAGRLGTPMPHVITQSCCSDGSCVYACPVNCIHPSPDEPGFATAEMLYIDPAACVDCGACVSACPVGAIAPETQLEPEQLPFVELNASFYPEAAEGKLPPTSKLAPVIEAPHVHARAGGPLTVAIVGSGPAAMYAADELLTQRGVRVNVFERLPTPYGLVRAGVAPDHQSTKRVTKLFDRIARRRGFHVLPQRRGGIGPDARRTAGPPPRRALCRRRAERPSTRHRRAWACPAPAPPPRSVAWINGHPEYTDLPVDLGHERVVIVGNGNVAFDVARILTTRPGCVGPHRHLRPRAGRAAGSRVQRGGDRGPPRPRAVGVHAARTHRPDVDVRGGARRRRPRSGASAIWPTSPIR